MGTASVVLLSMVSLPAMADDRGRFPLVVVEIHDGDSVLAAVRLPWRVTLGPEMIRAADYDAWEITKARRTVEVTDDEIKAGKAAREFLASLVESGELHVTPQAGGKRDVYGRLLGEFWLRKKGGEWVSVAEEMRRLGHVRK